MALLVVFLLALVTSTIAVNIYPYPSVDCIDKSTARCGSSASETDNVISDWQVTASWQTEEANVPTEGCLCKDDMPYRYILRPKEKLAFQDWCERNMSRSFYYCNKFEPVTIGLAKPDREPFQSAQRKT